MVNRVIPIGSLVRDAKELTVGAGHAMARFALAAQTQAAM